MNRFERSNIAEFEQLEIRQLLAVTPASVRSIDGTGNNLAHPTWGSTGVDLLRQGPAAYADKISTPAGANRPSAREISNALASQIDVEGANDRDMSAFIYAWGQFLDHDMDLTLNGASKEAFSVQVPLGDTSFDPFNTGKAVIPLSRSDFDPATGKSIKNPRQQTNSITAWIDASVVYGSDPTRAAALRSFVGGHLKTSDGNMLPFNTDGFANANDAHIFPDNQLFLAGDVRANENIELTSMQTLFVREHNRIADELAAANPKLTDEQLYQGARKMVIAEVQAITYNEFIPALMGSNALDPYGGYNSRVNPGISNEFSTAAFRVGHTMLEDDIEFLDNDGEETRDEVALAGAFFNPALLQETGVDPVLKYLASTHALEIDNQVVDSVRNFLFGPPGAGGLDLASLNIQRGRDHGLADYNSTRAAYGLKQLTSFDQITSDPVLAGKLKDLYGSINNVDLWVGGLAEDHVKGSSLGPTFQAILADQFERLRDGDRFWFENTFSGKQLKALEKTTLADVIRNNTGIDNLQDNVFIFQTRVTGVVYNDRNGNGKQDTTERGLSGWLVEILDENGEEVGVTTTNRSGKYSFEDVGLGTYSVKVETPAGNWSQTTDEPELEFTRGMTLSNVNIGYARADVGGTIVNADFTNVTDDTTSSAQADTTDASDLVLA